LYLKRLTTWMLPWSVLMAFNWNWQQIESAEFLPIKLRKQKPFWLTFSIEAKRLPSNWSRGLQRKLVNLLSINQSIIYWCSGQKKPTCLVTICPYEVNSNLVPTSLLSGTVLNGIISSIEEKGFQNNHSIHILHFIKVWSLIWAFQQARQKASSNAMNSHPTCSLNNSTLGKSPCSAWRKSQRRILGLFDWPAFWKWRAWMIRPKSMGNNWCQAQCCMFSPRKLSSMAFLLASRMVSF